jgi:hypothetical protein
MVVHGQVTIRPITFDRSRLLAVITRSLDTTIMQLPGRSNEDPNGHPS